MSDSGPLEHDLPGEGHMPTNFLCGVLRGLVETLEEEVSEARGRLAFSREVSTRFAGVGRISACRWPSIW